MSQMRIASQGRTKATGSGSANSSTGSSDVRTAHRQTSSGSSSLHHQQGYGDREHGVGEVHNPVEATVLAVARVAGR